MKNQAFTDNEIHDFIDAYITAMLWSTRNERDDEERIADEDLLGYELDRESRDLCVADCAVFLHRNARILDLAMKYDENYSIPQAGHDFWLTRAGHGAGFWDRGLGAIGDHLTLACRDFPERSPYLGDDGLVYL